MSFFLLGKGSDEQLRLLSTTPAASRKEALAELSALTAQASFSDWDLEVYVLDLETGTPVLLVRPSEPSSAQELGVTREPMSVAEETETIVTREDLDEPAAPVAPVAEEPSVELEAEPEPVEPSVELEAEPVTREEDEVEIEDEALAAVFEDLSAEEPESVATLVSEEPTEPAPAAEPVGEAWAEAVMDTEAEAEEAAALREAIARTAAHMEASGIVTPASVGPDEEASVAQPSEEEAPEEQGSPEAGWPWAKREDEADRTAFAIDALEEPGTDEGSLVRAPGDDETMSFARPVILGNYEGASHAEGGASSSHELPEVEQPAPVEEAGGESAAVIAAEKPEEPAGEEGETVASPGIAESDFLLDLEQLVETPSPEPAGYQTTAVSDVREMTCNECIYVQTCPNRDQRDPATCGSFQWK